MNKSRDKEESPPGSADQLLPKGPAENILVFLVLAVFILAAGFFCGHRPFFQEYITLPPAETSEKYVWLTGKPGMPEGLYVFTPEQLQNNFPGIGAAEEDSLVYALQYNGAAPEPASLPPAVANIFFQPIPINRADKNILTSLPGIGPVLAERIVQHRTRHGPFRSKDELLQIAGIGPKKFTGLADRITLD